MEIDDEVRDVTISELFKSSHSGRITLAVAPSGHIASIVSVPSGLDCGCVCVVCRRPLIAKKGTRQVHHFAHRPDEFKPSCAKAGETLLHMYAKELLAREKRLYFPDLEVEDELGSLTLFEGRMIEFEKVELELRVGNVVPDVVGTVKGRKLFVEFKVTHAVDTEKLERLRELDVGVIEVDLSDCRWMSLEEAEEPILVSATRRVLQSHLLSGAKDALRARKRALRAFVNTFTDDIRNARRSTSSRAGRETLADAIYVADEDDALSPISVDPAVWKRQVLLLLRTGGRNTGLADLIEQLDLLGWIDQRASQLDAFTRGFAKAYMGTTILTAEQHLKEFLSACDRHGIVRRISAERWRYVGISFEGEDWSVDGETIELLSVDQAVSTVFAMAGLGIAANKHFDFRRWFCGEMNARMAGLLSTEAQVMDEIHSDLVELIRSVSNDHAFGLEKLMALPCGSVFDPRYGVTFD